MALPLHAAETAESTGAEDTQKVTVTGNRDAYAVTHASTGTMTDTPILETPLLVEVIPARMLREQSVRSSGLTDTLAYLGVQTLGLRDQGEVTIFRGFTSWTTLWNGFRIEDIGTGVGPVNGGVWMDDVDRLEVVKGPASALYGRAEPGGAVNVLTRRPQTSFGGEAWAGVGSDADRWAGLDLTGPVDADKTVLLRLDLAREQSHSRYRWGADYRSQGIAPALEWRVSPRTTLSLEGQFRELEGQSGQPYMPVDPATGQALPVDPKLTLLPGNDARFRQQRYYLEVHHRWDDGSIDWKVMHNDADNPYSGANYVLGFGLPVVDGMLPASLMVGFNRTRQRTDATMIDAVEHLQALGLRHTVLVGGDYYRRRTGQTSGWDFSQSTDYFHPSPPLPVPGTDSWNIASHEGALILQDQVDLPARWHVLAGLRYQALREHSVADSPSLGLPLQDVRYDKTAWLPRIGVLWQPRQDFSAYYSYSQNLGANTGLDYAGRALKPEWARQHELGAKAEWLAGRLGAQFAVFELTKFDIASDDPAHPGFNIDVGEVRSTGFEFNLQGAPTERWNLLLNLSSARPVVIRGTSAASLYSGPSIVQGQQLPYVSDRTASLWTSYRPSAASWKGWTFAGGLHWASAPNPQDGSQVPTRAYATVSAMAAYETRWGGHGVSFQFNVDNLFDKRYLLYQGDYAGVLGGNWGAPRQFKFNLRTEI